MLSIPRLYHIFVGSVALTLCCFCFDMLIAFSKCNFASGNMYLLSFNNMIFPRSEIAWKNANYAQILEYLREEYELNQRFGSLDFKLKFVEVSALCTNSYSAKNCFFFLFEFAFVLIIYYCNSTTSIFFKKSSKIDDQICWSGVS